MIMIARLRGSGRVNVGGPLGRRIPGSTGEPWRRAVTSSAETGADGEGGTVHVRTPSDGYLHRILQARVYDVCKETALQHAPVLSAKYRNNIFLKREDTQPVFSFKLRGAYNKIANLTAEQRRAGIVACSAGNHAQGVAMSAACLGVDGIIVMPTATPAIKVNAVRGHGGNVVLYGDSYDEAQEEALRLVESAGRTLIHPFDDPLVIAGQGTIAMEILKQVNGKELDAIFVCCGGGGMLAGVLAYVKRVRPEVKIFGVEAEDAAGMTASVAVGRRVELENVGIFADGAAVKLVGNETFRLVNELVDGMITVTNDQICAAIKDGFTDTRGVLEPAGALGIAGMKKYMRDNGETDNTYVAIASGANMDFDRLRFVSERADLSETLLSVTLPDRPGTFDQLYGLVYPRNVTELSYRITHSAAAASVANAEARDAHVIISFQPNQEHGFGSDAEAVMDGLRDAGFGVKDLSHNEMAKAHGRHLSGGRAQGVEHERLYRFEFPERPGALRDFLALMQKTNRRSSKAAGSVADAWPSSSDAGDVSLTWNISLFHYRNHGADIGRVMVGFQVPPAEDPGFQHFLDKLGYTAIDESDNAVYRQFLM